MTTHEMARQLLALPDVPLVIEGWCVMDDYETVAEMTEYDPEGTAIIWQKPTAAALTSMRELIESAEWSWRNLHE